MELSPQALAMIAEVFGPQSRVQVPVSALKVVEEIQQWLASRKAPE